MTLISSYLLVERYLSGRGARLAAFAKAVCVYFLVGGGAPGPLAAVAKCAPVLCLTLTVLAHRADLPPTPACKDSRRYALLIAGGLALSMVGDALLVWPHTFEPGMAAFSLAHALYIAAFGWEPLALGLAPPLYLATAGYLYVVRAPGLLRTLVPMYALVLCTTAWRGGARGGAATAGALLFLLSDAALGCNMFHRPLKHPQMIVMSTYYLAQLCIALSALHPPAPPHSDSRPPTPTHTTTATPTPRHTHCDCSHARSGLTHRQNQLEVGINTKKLTGFPTNTVAIASRS